MSEDAELQSLAEDLAGAMASPWEPRCVMRAFAPAGPQGLAFTMQVWVALEVVRSPLLLGEPLLEVDDLALAFEAFGLEMEGMEPSQAQAIEGEMRRVIAEGFGMALQMVPPSDETDKEEDDGFGGWLPLYAFLVGRAGLSPAAARAEPVGCAYALMAAIRRNEGWTVGGLAYGWRDAIRPVRKEATDA